MTDVTGTQVTGDVRVPRWQRFLLAVGSLVLVYGLGAVVMLAGGAVVHAVDPTKRMDIFAALHNRWVVGALLGITVLWLLPPYPWAKRVVASGSQEQPAHAGETEGGGYLTTQEPGAVSSAQSSG